MGKPFDNKNNPHGDLYRNVQTVNPKFPPEVFYPDATDLLKRLLEKDPLKRIGITEGT